MPQFIRHNLTIPAQLAGQRLDQVLAELLSQYSRTRIKEWIQAGAVRLDGARPRPRDRVVGGESVVLSAPRPAEAAVGPQPIELVRVHEDRHVLVIDKPAGLVVHPGAGNAAGTLQNALLHFDPQLAQVPRAGLVHRLDKDTSGLLVVARTVEVHAALVRALAAHEVQREYEAVCVGVMTAGGSVAAPIGRHRLDRLRMAVRAEGRQALTHYRVLQRFRGHTHVRVKLATGRTHQIRVHLAHVGYPLVGDRLYGGRAALPRAATAQLLQALRNFRRQALHAARLEFRHPVSAAMLRCETPAPADMQALLAALAHDAAAAR